MKYFRHISIALFVIFQVTCTVHNARACRVASEKLTNYVTARVKRMLEPSTLSLIYWADEPLDASILGQATGLNIAIAETRFDLSNIKSNDTRKETFINDLFIACSADKGRQNVIAVNLELENPFKRIRVQFAPEGESSAITFNLILQQASFLVQLTQQIGYEECLHINYVQLTSNVEYMIDCDECSESHHKQLDRMFKKRISHLDSELCTLLSDKLTFGLRHLLDQDRLDIESNL